ncbi:MAG: YkvA family protein [Methylococcaceae bacterium]
MSDDKKYTEDSFWGKIKKSCKKAGSETIEMALKLFYAAKEPDTPVWAKSTIYSALAYFISPLDAIPDITPVIGYVDDVGVLTAAVATVSTFINENVKEKAKQKLKDWFG